MSDCIFCRIIQGDIPAAKVFENERLLAFLDAFPARSGHCLIVPKKHQRNLLEMDPEDLQSIILLSQNIAAAQIKVFKADGIRVQQFNGEAAGQSVFHYHMHLIPCYQGQATVEHGDKTADPQLLQQQAQALSQALANAH